MKCGWVSADKINPKSLLARDYLDEVFDRSLIEMVFGAGQTPKSVLEDAEAIGITPQEHAITCIDDLISDGFVTNRHEIYKAVCKELEIEAL